MRYVVCVFLIAMQLGCATRSSMQLVGKSHECNWNGPVRGLEVLMDAPGISITGLVEMHGASIDDLWNNEWWIENIKPNIKTLALWEPEASVSMIDADLNNAIGLIVLGPRDILTNAPSGTSAKYFDSRTPHATQVFGTAVEGVGPVPFGLELFSNGRFRMMYAGSEYVGVAPRFSVGKVGVVLSCERTNAKFTNLRISKIR